MSGVPGGSRAGPDDDPDRYAVGAVVAAGAEGILFRGSISRAGVEVEVAVKMLQPRFLPRVDEWHELWDDQVHLLRSLRTPGVVAVREGFLGVATRRHHHPPSFSAAESAAAWLEGENPRVCYSIRIPDSARAMTSCWICSVPSNMS